MIPKKQLVEICKKMGFGQKVSVEYQEDPRTVANEDLVFRKYEETDDGKCVVWLSRRTVRGSYDSLVEIPDGHLPQMDNTEILTFIPKEYVVNTSSVRGERQNITRALSLEHLTTPRREPAYREPVLA